MHNVVDMYIEEKFPKIFLNHDLLKHMQGCALTSQIWKKAK